VGVRALLLSLTLLLGAAPAAAAQDALDRAAEALRDDPVYVDPDAGVEVDADELRRRIGRADRGAARFGRQRARARARAGEAGRRAG
jgi:hypothetical protein